jgi:transposase
LGLSAEMVALIVRNQLADAKAKAIDPQRVITDVGIDELSLKKRHQLYATLLTDLTNPEHPEVLAVAAGRDEAAARKCLEKLAEPQRQRVRTYRADLAQAFHNACRGLLEHAKPVVDRFHVAKLFNKAIDGQRKKNHPGVQGETVEGGAEGVPVAEVGVPSKPAGAIPGGEAEARGVISPASATANAVRDPGTVPADL